MEQNQEFSRGLVAKLMAAGICPGSDGEISVAVGDLADFIGRLTIENIEQFVQAQRMAGVQTVHYFDVAMPDGYSFLAQRMVEFGIIPDALRVEAEKVLRERVVDIRPLVTDLLIQACAQHVDLAGLSFDPKFHMRTPDGRALKPIAPVIR